MIETLHVRARIRARLEAGPLGPYVDGFVDVLTHEGYARGVVRRYVRAVERFARWLRPRRIPPAQIDERVVARFVAQCGRTVTRARPGGRLPDLASGVRTFARVLWTQAVAPRSPAATTEAARWLIAFDQHLTTVHGLARGTRRIYLRYARALLATQRGRSAPLWAGLTADDVTEFVRTQAARLAPATCRMPVTATRAILRFLTVTGAGRPGMDAAVPTIRQWKHATLPRHLTRAQVDAVLAPGDATTVVARRNQAIGSSWLVSGSARRRWRRCAWTTSIGAPGACAFARANLGGNATCRCPPRWARPSWPISASGDPPPRRGPCSCAGTPPSG